MFDVQKYLDKFNYAQLGRAANVCQNYIEFYSKKISIFPDNDTYQSYYTEWKEHQFEILKAQRDLVHLRVVK